MDNEYISEVIDESGVVLPTPLEERERETFSYIGSSGEMESYPNPYANAANNAEAAQRLEEYMIEVEKTLDQNFLKLGAALAFFEDNEYYLARGCPSMHVWLNGTELHVSYKLANDLMRVVRNLVPLLTDGNEDLPNLSVSSMRELLPLLADNISAEDMKNVAGEIEGMTVRDARRHVRELRGIEEPEQPTIFRARVETGEEYHRVWITRTGEDGDIYSVNNQPLTIKPKDWARWQDRFGVFISYAE